MIEPYLLVIACHNNATLVHANSRSIEAFIDFRGNRWRYNCVVEIVLSRCTILMYRAKPP